MGQLISCYMPFSFSWWLAEKIADFFYIFPGGKYKRYREAIFHNLRFAGEVSVEEQKRCGKAVFRNFAHYLREFLWLGRIKKERFFREAIPVGVENLDAALSKRKGVLLLSAHFGNWEWGGISLSLCGYRLSFLVRPHTNPHTNRLFYRLREKHGAEVIPATHLKRAIGALRENKVVATLIDEAEEGVEVEICGRKINLAKGPFEVACKFGVPVCPAFMIRDKKTGKQKGVVEPPIWPDSRLGFQDNIKTMAQDFARVMEDYIRFYPDHWFLFKKKSFW